MSTDINNFLERNQVMDLHDKFFDPDSETEVSFLFDKIAYYEFLKEKKFLKLKKLLKQVEDNLWSAIKKFDESKFEQIK